MTVRRADTLDRLIGANIRRLRISRGLSQAALAQRLGISFQQLQKYENASNRIAASRLVALAQTLGVPPAALLGEHTGSSHAPAVGHPPEPAAHAGFHVSRR